MILLQVIIASLFSHPLLADEVREPSDAAKEPAKTEAKEAVKESPKETEETRRLRKYLAELFEVSKKVNSSNAGEKKHARSEIDHSMEWDKVAQNAIGPETWKKTSGKNQKEFRDILKDVISTTAYSRLDKFWKGATYKFDKLEVNNGKAYVLARFTVNGSDFSLEYYLEKSGPRWTFYDIAYEGEKYSENIHEQIDNFLKESNFASLLDKLRKRREELRSAASR